MDRLSQRTPVARRALGTLEEVLAGGLDDAMRRDAAIQRFKNSFEAVVKTVQAFLIEREGTRAASPKAAARASFRIDPLSEEECAHAISMVDDRNLTVHTYNESLAIALSRRLEDHAILLRKWLDRTAEALDAQPH